MSSNVSASTRKRAKPEPNEEPKDEFVYISRISTDAEFPDEVIGGVFTDKWAANIDVLEHDGILDKELWVDQLAIRYDDEDLINVEGVVGEGEQLNWRVEKHQIRHETRSAEECDKLAESLAAEMRATTFVPRPNKAKRAKRK